MKTISPTSWHRWMMRLRTPPAPDRIDQPFRVLSHTTPMVDVGAKRSRRRIRVRQYEVEVPYRNMGGEHKTGAARLFVPRDAPGPMPLIAIMHYELGLDGAGEHLARGWAVMTPRETLNPFGDGVNLNLALVQACRRLPFVDSRRIALTGGSAGGYVTLMVASETFPVAAVAALAPLVSMPYNVEFFAKNFKAGRCGAKDHDGNDASCAPIFCAVAEALIGFSTFLGPLAKAWRAWLRNSPVGVMDLVTCPVLATFTTADTLVPVNQVSDRCAVRPAKGVFPQRFEFGRRALVAISPARKTFMQAAARRSQVFRYVLPDGLTKFWETTDVGAAAAKHDVPCLFSKSQSVSVAILDEGAPDPRLGHFKYCFRYSMVPFLRHWLRRTAPVAVDQLTLGKLELLMRRFLGQEPDPLVGCAEPGKPPTSLTRRNSAAREKADVIAGLQAYCESGAAHCRRLATLYRKLPASLRALDIGAARFDEDVTGGLAYHGATLEHAFGSHVTAGALARGLVSRPEHAAYAARLPERLLPKARAKSRSGGRRNA